MSRLYALGSFLLLTFVFGIVLSLTSCRCYSDCWSGVECEGGCYECCEDKHCSDGEVCCFHKCCSGHCGAWGCEPCYEECCIDDDCLGKPEMSECSQDNTICNDDYECECACYKEGKECWREPEACCDGLVCDIFTNVCVTECTDDSECSVRTEIPFGSDLVCIEGICDFEHCKNDLDCLGGMVCYEESCVTVCYCDDIAECVVSPGSGVTTQGTTVQFGAIPYLHTGAIAPGYTFSWSSSDNQVVSIDQNGLSTGGANTGEATITATVQGSVMDYCNASVINYGGSIGARVVVVDENENTPIEGATVLVDTQEPVLTDQYGVAAINFIDPGDPSDVTVSHREYNYVTLRSVEKNDVMVQLRRLHQMDFSQDPPALQAGGIKGKFNLDMIRCEPPQKTCDVPIALAGLSIPGGLFDMLSEIIDGRIRTEFRLGGSNMQLLLPAGMVLCLNQTCFKELYTPTGIPGNRVAWGLGGKLDLADLINGLGAELSGGEDILFEKFLFFISPFFENFYSSMVPNVDVTPRPMVEDVNDIDDDPATTEVPDYDNFPRQDLTFRMKLDQALAVHPPPLPLGVYDFVYVIGGLIVPGAGFVPMGVGVGADSIGYGDVPDGIIDDPIVLYTAYVAGRIPEGNYVRVIVALAVDSSRTADDQSPRRWSGQVVFVDSFSGNIFLDDFLLPAQATFDPASKVLSVIDLPTGADYSQAVFSDGNGAGWNILGEWATGDYVLPMDPDPQNPRSDKVSFIQIYLQDGIGYQDLVEFNSSNLGDLSCLVKAFSYTEVGGP